MFFLQFKSSQPDTLTGFEGYMVHGKRHTVHGILTVWVVEAWLGRHAITGQLDIREEKTRYAATCCSSLQSSCKPKVRPQPISTQQTWPVVIPGLRAVDADGTRNCSAMFTVHHTAPPQFRLHNSFLQCIAGYCKRSICKVLHQAAGLRQI